MRTVDYPIYGKSTTSEAQWRKPPPSVIDSIRDWELS